MTSSPTINPKMTGMIWTFLFASALIRCWLMPLRAGFWLDETGTYYVISGNWHQFLDRMSVSIQSPLYCVLWAGLSQFGVDRTDSEGAVYPRHGVGDKPPLSPSHRPRRFNSGLDGGALFHRTAGYRAYCLPESAILPLGRACPLLRPLFLAVAMQSTRIGLRTMRHVSRRSVLHSSSLRAYGFRLRIGARACGL